MTRVLVVGCGSIGLRHLANLRALGGTETLACDLVPERAERAAAKTGARIVPSLEAGLEARPAAVVVCTPPDRHLAPARAALEAGADVLIEKPIADRLDGLDGLLAAARQPGRVVMVGYNLRFHPGLQRVKELIEAGAVGRALAIYAEFGQYLPDWRRGQDYRAGYFGSAAAGGGIILDVSHEIDYVRWLGGEVRGVSAMAEHVSDLEGETEDLALIALRLAGGSLAHVALDCLRRDYTRSCKVVGTEGTLTWEFHGGVRLYAAKDGQWQALEEGSHDANETYRREVAHFLACVRREAQPPVDGAEGVRVLQIALAAKESARRRQEVEL